MLVFSSSRHSAASFFSKTDFFFSFREEEQQRSDIASFSAGVLERMRALSMVQSLSLEPFNISVTRITKKGLKWFSSDYRNIPYHKLNETKVIRKYKSLPKTF